MNLQFKAPSITVCELDINGCAEFGKSEFLAALKKSKLSVNNINHWTEMKTPVPFIVVGTSKNRRVQILLENAGVDYHSFDPESTFLQWCEVEGGKKALLISGSDETGLMYNLLEMARRIEKDGINALNNAENLAENPQNAVRCMDRYLLGHLDEEWLKSEEFWHYFLARLAKNRFNRFCLILGFDTAYMAPPYPYFVETPSFPKVKVNGIGEKERKENVKMFRKIGALCHQYGIKFDLATWQQRPWTTEQEELVQGLPEDVKGLSAYCYEGIKNMVTAIPEIDIVQFRVNHESGVGDQVSAEDFWNRCADAVADVADETGRPLILDLRAKGLTDSMIAHAFSRGLPVEVPTKFWCEHAALPYHLSIMRTEELDRLNNFNHSRRYSYADMLKKPKYYDVIYRLWNYGSTNLFLWGDVDYARRFSLSCGLSGSTGFQINTPLSLKYGHELSHIKHWDTFAKKELRYGKWEDERFWMWYITFGRLGYNPDTDPSVWQDEFAAHFGEAGVSLEKALAVASKIVPFVTTIHMPVHPSLRYWTEMSTGWGLFGENNIDESKDYDPGKNISYGSTEPSDHGLFYGIDEYVKDYSAGKLSGKYSPLQSAVWLEDMANETEKHLAAAEKKAKKEAEYLAMKVDMTMLCDLARYHAAKIRSACALAFFKKTKKAAFISDSLLLLNQAIAYWNALSEKGKENYYHDLDFSSAGSKTRRGTWGDLTKELLADKESLLSLLKSAKSEAVAELSASYLPENVPVESFQIAADFPDCVKAGEALTIDAAFASFGELDALPVLHYRHVDQTEGVFHTLKMSRTAHGYSAVIPAKYITADWDLQIYITVQGSDGSCVMFPGVYHPVYPYPYHVITVEK
jgi:hypothetical protein